VCVRERERKGEKGRERERWNIVRTPDGGWALVMIAFVKPLNPEPQ